MLWVIFVKDASKLLRQTNKQTNKQTNPQTKKSSKYLNVAMKTSRDVIECIYCWVCTCICHCQIAYCLINKNNSMSSSRDTRLTLQTVGRLIINECTSSKWKPYGKISIFKDRLYAYYSLVWIFLHVKVLKFTNAGNYVR